MSLGPKLHVKITSLSSSVNCSARPWYWSETHTGSRPVANSCHSTGERGQSPETSPLLSQDLKSRCRTPGVWTEISATVKRSRVVVPTVSPLDPPARALRSCRAAEGGSGHRRPATLQPDRGCWPDAAPAAPSPEQSRLEAVDAAFGRRARPFSSPSERRAVGIHPGARQHHPRSGPWLG